MGLARVSRVGHLHTSREHPGMRYQVRPQLRSSLQIASTLAGQGFGPGESRYPVRLSPAEHQPAARHQAVYARAEVDPGGLGPLTEGPTASGIVVSQLQARTMVIMTSIRRRSGHHRYSRGGIYIL